MEDKTKCTGCKNVIEDRTKKFSIFARDIQIKKCLVYKIHQLTGVDYLYFGNNTAICNDCHNLLVQIHFLEEKFVQSFNKPEGESATKDIPKTFENLKINLDSAEFGKEIIESAENVEDMNENFGENKIIQKLSEEFEEANKTETAIEKPKTIKREQIVDEIENLGNETFSKLMKEKKSHKCWICGKIFTQRYHMVQHERTHTGERPNKCKDCDKAFINNTELNRHVRLHHEGNKYQCEECGKELLNLKTVRRHKIMHKGIKPFQCSRCPKKFLEGKLVKLHELRVHINDGSQMCDQCPRAFSLIDDLTRHKKVQHKILEDVKIE